MHDGPANGRGYPRSDADPVMQMYRAAGMEPGWTRVWDDGIDVTDQDPATWPWPWNPDARQRRHALEVATDLKKKRDNGTDRW